MTAQDIRPGDWRARLAALEARRTQPAGAPLPPVRTIADRTDGRALRAIASPWTAAAFDGPFYETPADGRLSAGVVFVRSREGNTGTRNPAALGGGAVDEHLVYEGLSRVAADAVIAGAGTLHADAFFTVWHPELVALRERLGLPRHPAQVILSAEGSVAPDALLLFNVPSVPVFVLASPRGRERLAPSLAARPWATVLAAASLHEQFAALAARGIRRACCVGGRHAATALVDAGLVQDVYLTTTSVSGGEPGTPWYIGAHLPPAATILAKAWDGEQGPVQFEHLQLTSHGQT
jgi:5-amino-6-(5-phosphoribosylamino)uracil reductase